VGGQLHAPATLPRGKPSVTLDSGRCRTRAYYKWDYIIPFVLFSAFISIQSSFLGWLHRALKNYEPTDRQQYNVADQKQGAGPGLRAACFTCLLLTKQLRATAGQMAPALSCDNMRSSLNRRRGSRCQVPELVPAAARSQSAGEFAYLRNDKHYLNLVLPNPFHVAEQWNVIWYPTKTVRWNQMKTENINSDPRFLID
jgi:hypothetical protein